MPSFFSANSSSLSTIWHNQRIAIPVAIIIVTVVLVSIFKLIQPVPPVKEKTEKSWVVQTTRLDRGAKTPQLELYGKVESPYSSSLTSTVTADVISLVAREGQHVDVGDTLLILDDSEASLIVQQRRSDVSDLKAQIESEITRHKNDLATLKLEKSLVSIAEKKLQREEKTSKSNLTSQSSYDTQKQALQTQQLALKARQLNVDNHPARLAQLEARLKQKQAQLEQAEKDLDSTTVTAPFKGIVLKTHVSPGERVRPSEALVDVYSTDQIELRAQLPQKHVDDVRRALANGEQLPAYAVTSVGDIPLHLHRISGTFTKTGSGVDALFQIQPEDADKLIIGEVLDIIVDLPEIKNVYSIPVSSLYGTNRIYRVTDGRLEMVQVERVGNQLVDRRNSLLIKSDTLHDGDEVITTQLPHAISGLKVEIRGQSSSSESLPVTP